MNLSEIWNTPGYFYTIGYVLSAVTVLAARRGRFRWRDWAANAGLFLFLGSFMDLTRGATGVGYALSILVIVGAMYLRVSLTMGHGVTAGFYCVKAFILGELLASSCWLIYYYAALKWTQFQSAWGIAVVLVPVYLLIACAIWLVERRLNREASDLVITPRDLLLVGLTASAVYVVSNLGYVDRNGIFSGSFARDVFAIRTLVDLSGAVLIFAFQSQLIELRLRYEKDMLHTIMDTQYQAYLLSRESIDMVNQKYHDLKHQIALLKTQAESGRASDMLGQIERDIQSYEARNQTGNAVLDAMLTNKSLYCQQHGIELRFITDGKLLDFMEDVDICALFGNMLDNAIEGVERLDDPGKRLIRLYVVGENQFLRIRIENYCEERVHFQDGMPVTTKRDKRYHGFGMKSMQRTVAKYGGSMVAGQNDNWFELKILIPLTRRAA